jgi:integrase
VRSERPGSKTIRNTGTNTGGARIGAPLIISPLLLSAAQERTPGASQVHGQENSRFGLYLIPAFGRKRLDAIKSEDVQRLKAQLEVKSPKTVNNILAVLSILLKKAVEWDVIERMPCRIKLLSIEKDAAAFHDFEEYERLVEVARAIDQRTYLIVLLGGEAGLRCGEVIAIEWGDVDLAKRQLCVRRSDWNGHVGTPKGGRLRFVPLTRRLTAALVLVSPPAA